MKYEIDTDNKTLKITDDQVTKSYDLFSSDGFEKLSDIWVNVGWHQKHLYTFSWLGRPIIQLPDDMLRMQEVIYDLKPDVIIETGVAHGGSLVFYAGLMEAIGKGRVIGVDIEIRPHNRKAIEAHRMFKRIELVEGNSISQEIISHVQNMIKTDEKVLVILDSNHTYNHVLAELEAYSQFVSVGSYIVSTDGLIKDLTDTPRGKKTWEKDNPYQAAHDFVQQHKDFEVTPPDFPFNESDLTYDNMPTHWPGSWVKRMK